MSARVTRNGFRLPIVAESPCLSGTRGYGFMQPDDKSDDAKRRTLHVQQWER